MYKITIMAVMWLAAGSLIAQPSAEPVKSHKQNNFYLDLSGGYNIAIGRYAGSDKEKDFTGYASNGFFIQLSGTWLGKRDFGLTASYCYQQNPLRSNADTITPVGFQPPLGKHPWNNHYLMAGPAYMHHFGKWLLMVKVQAGGVLSFSSNFTMKIPTDMTDTTGQTSLTISKGPGFGVAFQALAGVGYRITKNLTIDLTFSYLGANPSRTKDYYAYVYEKDPETGFYRLVYYGGEYQIKKKISTFNIGIGLAYRL